MDFGMGKTMMIFDDSQIYNRFTHSIQQNARFKTIILNESECHAAVSTSELYIGNISGPCKWIESRMDTEYVENVK